MKLIPDRQLANKYDSEEDLEESLCSSTNSTVIGKVKPMRVAAEPAAITLPDEYCCDYEDCNAYEGPQESVDTNPLFPETVLFDEDLFDQNVEDIADNMATGYDLFHSTEDDYFMVDDKNETILDEDLGVGSFVPVYLTAEDVPDATLPLADVAKNTKDALQRWLKWRSVPQGGTKDELVAKVLSCMEVGADKNLDPSVDGGKWYDLKRDMMCTQDASRLHSSDLFPEKGWDPFPSRDIPLNYNFGSVYYYLVESMPEYNDPSVVDVDDDSNDEGNSEENEESIPLGDIFEDPQNRNVLNSKKIRRGLHFLKSGHVRGVVDCLPNRFHVFKAHVKASMELKAYWVKAAISQISGNVLRCECQCVASSLGRCSHVSALLLFILQHTSLNGEKAITCTSKPCEWNKGSLKRDPSVAAGRQYESFKLNVLRRHNFDPRPTKFQQGPSIQMVKNFLQALKETKDTPCAFQGILKITHDDFVYDDVDLKIFQYLRRELYEYLNQVIPKYHTGHYEIEGTTEQFHCPLYKFIRSITCTASVCHKIAHFKKESAKKNFLRAHMWNIDTTEDAARAYGKEKELIAREAYIREQVKAYPDIQVVAGGVNLNTKYPGLSCSHDGWVITGGNVVKLLEIKCPYSLKNVDPHQFDSFLKGKRLRSFYLRRNPNGEIALKENTGYYDQVQMEMGMTGLTSCDFVVWSEKGLLIVPISFNSAAWNNLYPKLQKFHWEYLAVEYFARRTILDLNPVCLP